MLYAITGASGTVGSSIIKELIKRDQKVVGIDNDENGIFRLSSEFPESCKNGQAHFYCCDIRETTHLVKLFKGVDRVIHAAALKHVDINERLPFYACEVNINGTISVLEACDQAGVSKALFTSSDKAVNPPNVMGTTKLLGEKLFTTHNNLCNTITSSTRFGNVVGSSGSVLPIFLNQIRERKKITLTSRQMTRFMMSLQDATHLVLDMVDISIGGEVLVAKMPTISIYGLACALCKVNNLDPEEWITEIGPRPGEKMYEELMTTEETRRSYDLGNRIVIIPPESKPQNFNLSQDTLISSPYISSLGNSLNHDQILEFLNIKEHKSLLV